MTIGITRGLMFPILFLIAFIQPVQAGLFDKVVKVITAPVRLPVETTVRVITRDNPLEPVRETARAGGQLITQGSNELSRVGQLIISTERDAITKTLGGDWPKAFDALTAQERVKWEMARTAGGFLGKCLGGQNCNTHELVALPLAAALRDAYNIYWKEGQPLDARIKRILAHGVAPGFLDDIIVVYAARPDYTVPGFLNAGHKLFGKSHAVTIANLIIFSEPPQLQTRNDWLWLLHELKHCDQYMGFSRDRLESIDGFAVEYVRNWQHLEREADDVATERLARIDKACHGFRGNEDNC